CEILNGYEWISFNVGPTLLSWMRRHAPEVVERMRQGDAKSLARWGHGNALAQVYHHLIMPLAAPEDREVETRWAVDDFRALFGRDPEGLWLSEAAVDLPTLETLAAQGLRFIILAPRQARAVLDQGRIIPVTEETLFIGEPYRVRLPSGAALSVVFYNGALSRSIAFEALLSDGEQFWRRLSNAAANLASAQADPLLSIATDGETYGHHFKFGEMALAHVLAQAREQRDGLGLTNLASYLAAHPPRREVLLHEPSSWSCAHGVERWRSDCGCTDGGHPGWNQQWRKPLRRALNYVRSAVESHFAEAGAACLSNPRQALLAYGQVLAEPESAESFAAAWLRRDLPPDGGLREDLAWKLLAAQEQSLASFASCAWFFDDLARIEPENALTFALRAMDLLLETNGPDIREEFLRLLAPAQSNQPAKGSGQKIFFTDILPRKTGAAGLCLLACLLLQANGRWPAPGKTAVWSWPRLVVSLTPEETGPEFQQGTALIRSPLARTGFSHTWEAASSALNQERACFCPSALSARSAFGQEERCSLEDLAKPLREYLLGEILSGREQAMRPGLRAQARNILKLISPWPEEQHDVPHSFLLASLAPYMALECALDADLPAAGRAQIQIILKQRLSPDGMLLASRLLEEELLTRLKDALASSSGASTDNALAALLQRALTLAPVDLWNLQNCLWAAGPRRFPALAGVLGFS
ncbi:MAG: DUF3536 domain-containing protein, partial [Deltaproteobacteria bacterium]|nr:DUF3536 domain-containing protein [Deltaproteobacteria bacterium]